MKRVQKLLGALGVLSSRFAGLPANLSPLGSFGFFSGNSFLYFAIIVAHDLLRGGFYPGFWLTYIGFSAYPVLGFFSRRHWQSQVLLLPVASFFFFLSSNLGVWWYWYPHTSDALLACYLLALPFYQNTLFGDLIFGYGYLAARWGVTQVPLLYKKIQLSVLSHNFTLSSPDSLE